MDTSELMLLLRARWLIMVSTVVACLALGAILTTTTAKRYQANAQVFVSTVLPTDTAGLAAVNTFAVARVQSYVSLVNTPVVTNYVVAKLHLSMSPSALSHEISADAPLNKVIINIHVTDASPSRASAIANLAATEFAKVTQALEQTEGTTTSPVRMVVTKPATTPTSPITPRPKLNLLLALLVGLLLAYGLARVRAGFDESVKSVADLEQATDYPVLGAVPKRGQGGRGVSAPGGRRANGALTTAAFALIRSNLEYLDIDSPLRLLAVTSAVRGEGKTYVTTNVGATLAAAGNSVCLVDANLRSPSFVRLFKLSRSSGLTTALVRPGAPEHLVQDVTDKLKVVASGPVPPDPSGLFGSAQSREIVGHISRGFSYTILDTGAVLPHGDGVRAATLVQATILVVRARRTGRRDLARAIDRLAVAGIRPAGTILTMASPRVVKKLVEDAGGPAQIASTAITTVPTAAS